MKKRFLAVTLTAAMAAMSVMGCSQKPADSKAVQTSAAQSQAGAAGEEKSEAAGEAENSGETIKVGCIFPITGPNADQGVFNVDGCKLAVKQINENGGIKSMGGRQLELVVYDNQSDAEQAKAVAER